MPAEIVTAVYRTKPGKEPEMRDLLKKHLTALRASGLVTPRPRVLLRSRNAVYVEIFEWKDGAASAHAAHGHPEIGAVWESMGLVCEFTCLAELAESTERFPHFAPVDDLGT
jgi:hypothetical protein